jgi:hypothetical protein
VVSKRPSFIVRTRWKYQPFVAKRTLFGRRRPKWGEWLTIKACFTLEEALTFAGTLKADDIYVSHHGRRVNDKVHFDKPAPVKTVT